MERHPSSLTENDEGEKGGEIAGRSSDKCVSMASISQDLVSYGAPVTVLPFSTAPFFFLHNDERCPHST